MALPDPVPPPEPVTRADLDAAIARLRADLLTALKRQRAELLTPVAELRDEVRAMRWTVGLVGVGIAVIGVLLRLV